ncbi:hypothetical protein HYN59_14230 [Flavobacterium album]|uniref:Uncharacterized protein n=2 Tax=Flavobacterium album TaxID=2175091 RepID=A0A2S1R0P7_9FLAO|nr:hypothetical protein HYN59_14230 [Flavobacterium album]
MLLPLISLIIVSCKSDAEIAASYQWKWGEGFRVGDWIQFSDKMEDSGYYLDTDTIYKNSLPIALMQSTSFHYDCYIMIITSLDGKEKGIYFEKGDAKPTD